MFDSISTETSLAPRASTAGESHITVLPNRSRFEAAVSCILEHHTAGTRGSALLHVSVQSFSGTGSVSMRLLNLTGSALRAGMQDGEVAYLGDAEFAVFLHDTDARQAAFYARTMVSIIGNFRVLWEDEMLSISACVGGVMADDCLDGIALLRQAKAASRLARDKPGCRVHMAHAQDTQARMPMQALTQSVAAQASAS